MLYFGACLYSRLKEKQEAVRLLREGCLIMVMRIMSGLREIRFRKLFVMSPGYIEFNRKQKLVLK